MDSAFRNEYLNRINRVIDYIENNIDHDFTLKKLAAVAYFSEFHFHRIFKAIMGETLNQFIQRIRLEKAASRLLDSPHKPVTEIALELGFSGSASFARSFKEHFGVSASEWRKTSSGKTIPDNSKNRKKNRKIGKEYSPPLVYFDYSSNQQKWRVKMAVEKEFQVEVKELPAVRVAYVWHFGAFNEIGKAFGELFRWAAPRGLFIPGKVKVMSVYHDNPRITDESKLRTSACISIPEDTEISGNIGSMTIPAGKYAIAHFEIATEEFADAWDSVMGVWLPSSGYQPDDRPCFEIYYNDYREHPLKKHIVDICIPVKPL